MPDVVPFDLPFEEAIAFFRAKGIEISPESWRDVREQANARAFTVAADGAWILDYEGIQVRVNKGLLDYALSEADGREAFLGFIRPTIEHPFEVWLVQERTGSGLTKPRKRHIGLFGRNYLVVFDRYRVGWGVWDAFPISRAMLWIKEGSGN